MNKKLWPILLVAVSLTACAGSSAFHEAREEEALKHWDLAVLQYSRAVDLDPKRMEYQVALARAKMSASQFHFEKGKLYRSSGRPELAVVELEQAVVLDPTNQYAESELRKARDEAARVIAERNSDSKLESLKRRARGARARAPMLEPTSDRPINLNFPQPKPVKQIYQSLAAAAGINVIFDPQLKDENVAIVLTNISFQNALETLMRQENHFYKVIDEHTFLIAADTPQNRKTYEDLVLRTFYLSNGDITDVSNALRSLLQTTRIYPNKAENSITVRDTADKVAIAERIIEQNDKQLSEVVVDVELIQINTDKVDQIGLLLSNYSTTATAPAPGGTTNLGAPLPTGTFSWDQLRQLSIHSFGFTIPNVTLDLIKNNTGAEVLARPQLRISEGQKAQLIIGDKQPVPTTTFNTGTTIGGNIVPVTSFQYQDVGIKIEVEPRVHHNKEITLKLIVEVSNVSGFVPVQNGAPQPIISTRTISSNIRLKDGETNFLAGLYRTDKRATVDTIPFVGDIPVIGRLLSHKKMELQSTDIVLTMTPHIIRIPDITEEDLSPLYVGTDANISFQGSPRIETPGVGGPFDSRQPAPPRTQPATGNPPGPTNLVPGGLPSDPFRQPQQSIPPQPTPAPRPFGVDAAPSATFDFEPSTVSIAPGQQVSIVVRATGSDVLPEGSLVVTTDPRVVSVIGARPIFTGAGVSDSQVEPGRAVLQIPAGTPVSGTVPVAEIVLKGIAPGTSTLRLETPGGSGTGSVQVIKP